MKRREEDWIIIDRLADIIIAHNRDFSYDLEPWEPKGCIVEIGAGCSTSVLSRHAQEWKVKHYTCDINRSRKLHELHIVFKGPSFDFMGIFNDTPVLVLLDGSHHYEDVLVEVEFFLPRLVEGGAIFIHDTYPPFDEWAVRGKHCGDVYKLRQDLEKRDDIQSWTFTYTANSCGLTMVTNKEKNRIFCRK